MSVADWDLELRGVKIPDRESHLGELSAEQIVAKLNRFHERLRRESHLQVAPFAESYFLNLLALYPVSMCARDMSDALKLMAALFYFGSQPAKDAAHSPEQEARDLFPRNRPSLTYRSYSMEDLALIFDRTKGAVAEAIRQKQDEAMVMLEEAQMRCQRQTAIANESVEALERLTDEEKTEIVKEKTKVEEKRRRESLPC